VARQLNERDRSSDELGRGEKQKQDDSVHVTVVLSLSVESQERGKMGAAKCHSPPHDHSRRFALLRRGQLRGLSQLLVKLAVANRSDQGVDDCRKLVEGRNRDCGFALVELEGGVKAARMKKA
jgi:hypothetical protein